MLLGSGSAVLLNILGAEFGGILFRILRVLPSMTLVIFSGIFSDKEHAQSQVSVGVGVYAGITVFSLTVQWCLCMVSASKSFMEEESSDSINCFPSIKEIKLRILIENGVNVDEKTCRTAKIMLMSLIPYVVLQLAYVFDNSSGKRIVTLIALIVSSLSLISYFVYQIRDPWMQKRSLDYSRLDTVQRGLLQHVQQLGKLVNEDGKANIDLLNSFFSEADINGDKCIAVEELENLVSRVFKAGKADIDQNEAVAEVMSRLDKNKDERITKNEFINGFKQWIQEATHSSVSSNDFNPREMYHKALQLMKEKKRNNSPDIDKIMAKILKQAEGQMLKSEALIKENGEPNIERIKRLFEEFDTDGNGSLSAIELKQLIGRVKFGTSKMKDDDAINELYRVFDLDGNRVIDEQEFMKGVKGYLEKARKAVGTSKSTRILEEFEKMAWKEVLVSGKKAFFKSLFQVLIGISMLTFLAGPLMANILELSNATKLPSFLISFVVVPLVMNGRAAIAALLQASRRGKDSSLSFSEIYGGVIMNNMAGLTTLLAIVYAKDLTWDFSAEVLTIVVVCAVIGTKAFLSRTYHLWTCIPALLLYFISLGLFYCFQVFYSWN